LVLLLIFKYIGYNFPNKAVLIESIKSLIRGKIKGSRR